MDNGELKVKETTLKPKSKKPFIIIAVIVVVCILCATVLSGKTKPSTNRAFYSAEYKAEIKLGMHKDDVEKIFGEGVSYEFASNPNTYFYEKADLIVEYGKSNIANSIWVNNSLYPDQYKKWYATEGIHSGMSMDELAKKIGKENIYDEEMGYIQFASNNVITTDNDLVSYDFRAIIFDGKVTTLWLQSE